MLPWRFILGSKTLDLTTVGRQVGAGEEQVDIVGFGVGTGELDLFAEIVALGTGGHDSDCALLDLDDHFIALEAGCAAEVLLDTDGVLLRLGPVGRGELDGPRAGLVEGYVGVDECTVTDCCRDGAGSK